MKLLRRTIDIVNGAITNIGRSRRYSIPKKFEDVRLNLGCGMAVIENWINIDGSPNAFISKFPAIVHKLMYRATGARAYYGEEEYCRLLGDNYFLHHDLSYGIPLEDSQANYIFSSHFIEHLEHADAVHLLQECRRVLEPGGLMRVSIPDLEYAIGLYNSDKKEKMLRDYFFVDDTGNEFSRHKYMYDYAMFSDLLESVGFVDINRCVYQEGELPDRQRLDNRPTDSLFVEARKQRD